MKEGIGARVGRIISGSINALVDAMESAAPEVVMEEAIREVDGAIGEVRTELGKAEAARHLAASRLEEERRRFDELGANIELAVREGRDDLATAGIARQLDVEAQLPVLEQTIADAGAKVAELEGYVQALQAKKREMKDELARYAEARRTTLAGTSGGGAALGEDSVAVRVEKAESAFERILERETGIGDVARPDAEQAARLAELDELSRNNRIAERLAALKAKAEQ